MVKAYTCTMLQMMFIIQSFRWKSILYANCGIVASAQNILCNSFSCNIHLTISIIYLYLLSLTPFCSGVYGLVSWSTIFPSQRMNNFVIVFYFPYQTSKLESYNFLNFQNISTTSNLNIKKITQHIHVKSSRKRV